MSNKTTPVRLAQILTDIVRGDITVHSVSWNPLHCTADITVMDDAHRFAVIDALSIPRKVRRRIEDATFAYHHEWQKTARYHWTLTVYDEGVREMVVKELKALHRR